MENASFAIIISPLSKQHEEHLCVGCFMWKETKQFFQNSFPVFHNSPATQGLGQASSCSNLSWPILGSAAEYNVRPCRGCLHSSESGSWNLGFPQILVSASYLTKTPCELSHLTENWPGKKNQKLTLAFQQRQIARIVNESSVEVTLLNELE